MRILFHTTDFQSTLLPDGTMPIMACGYYRVGLPSQGLREFGGHETVVVPNIDRDPKTGEFVGQTWEGREVRGAEVVVLQKATQVPIEAITNARRAGQIVIWDLDDLLFDPLVRIRHGAKAATKDMKDMGGAPGFRRVPTVTPGEEPKQFAWPAWWDLAGHLRAVNAVTVSTDYLAERVRQEFNPNVMVIRNAINLNDWQVEDVSQDPVLGWAAVLDWRAGDHRVLVGWLEKFIKRHRLSFVHVGHVEGQRSFASAARIDPKHLVTTRPAKPFLEYLDSRPLRGITTSLVPLANESWNEAKSALKGMESAACGIPFVASPSTEYKKLGFGSLAGMSLAGQGPKDWEAALEPLLDKDERVKAGQAARDSVEAQDIRVRWADWERAYSSLLEAAD